MRSRISLALAMLGLLAAAGSHAADDELLARAQAIHERVLTLDTHVDIPLNFATSEFIPATAAAQVNLQNMREGGLNAAFFIVYTGQTPRNDTGYAGAKADAAAKFSAIHRMVDLQHEGQIALATTADEVRSLHVQGKLVALIGMENGYVIGKDLGLLQSYRELGARYLTLVHNGHNDIGDSAQPQARLADVQEEHGGLSDFGKQVVQELNRLGIIVDISHVSRQTMLDATRLSTAPVIASHSGVTTVFDHPRNLDDEQLLILKENGGVVQLVAFDVYLKQGGGANVSDFVDHIDHAVQLIGIDHVGISSDFGGGGGIQGWSNAGETLNVTLELLRRGYSEEDIGKIWSGNTLRIMEAAEKAASWP